MNLPAFLVRRLSVLALAGLLFGTAVGFHRHQVQAATAVPSADTSDAPTGLASRTGFRVLYAQRGGQASPGRQASDQALVAYIDWLSRDGTKGKAYKKRCLVNYRCSRDIRCAARPFTLRGALAATGPMEPVFRRYSQQSGATTSTTTAPG